MSFSVGTNLSALRALGEKMAVTAHNVAHASSNGFQPARAQVEAGSNGAVRVDIRRDQAVAPGEQDPPGNREAGPEPSGVDLGRELVETIPTSRGYEANLEVVRTRDALLGTVIDLIQ